MRLGYLCVSLSSQPYSHERYSMDDVALEKRRISYSQYSVWKDCPHQYFLSYVKKLKPKDQNIYGIFGTAIHEAIQIWLDKHFNESTTLANVFDADSFFKDRMIELCQESIVKDADGNVVSYPCDKAALSEF